MEISELWQTLEADAANGKTNGNGWLLRLAQPDAACRLFVGIELASNRRAVLLQLPSALVPTPRHWPRCKGLEPFLLAVGECLHFGVALKEARFGDVFTALTGDLLRRIAEAVDPASQIRVFVGQLARWQRFLSSTIDALSEESQRGLYGELYCLREYLIPKIGTTAVNGWKGFAGAHQDFQFETGAVEVKTTLAKQPQVIRISSERQLDSRSWVALFLNVIALDVHDVGGDSLPKMVAAVRAKLCKDASANELFEDALLAVGYHDIHVTRYAERGYKVRNVGFFKIAPHFPRLVEADMPTGVGDVNYALSVSACEKYRVSPAIVLSALAPSRQPKSKRKRND